ncbi:LytR/AlgR family response regulator transcription factor [Winogradskyella sp.]|uniref:LytR/AlgR family response regulator transcription factor n=1 Tax=Winogradskyella sp. TaxID=1883156 RepID=UPI003AB752F4
MEKYDVLIIDDERLAREEVKRYLIDYPEFKIVGEADNAETAKQLIETKKPQLIFLDIEMPEKTGFDLLQDLDSVPEVVFTTAYSEYAAKAFEVNAIDYLVKPIRAERFSASIEKALNELSRTKQTATAFSMNQKIFIKDGDKCFFVPLVDIRYIESIENYARFHFKGNRAMIKKTLNSIEEKLDTTVFFRINRGHIVNIHYIKDVFPQLNNRLKIVLETGEAFDVSSRQSVRFKNWNSL